MINKLLRALININLITSTLDRLAGLVLVSALLGFLDSWAANSFRIRDIHVPNYCFGVSRIGFPRDSGLGPSDNPIQYSELSDLSSIRSST